MRPVTNEDVDIDLSVGEKLAWKILSALAG
jgi:hypothetical protein